MATMCHHAKTECMTESLTVVFGTNNTSLDCMLVKSTDKYNYIFIVLPGDVYYATMPGSLSSCRYTNRIEKNADF